jgi:polyhydroxybutyrate depolymerase
VSQVLTAARALVLGVLVSVPGCRGSAIGAPAVLEEHLDVGGIARTFLVYVPREAVDPPALVIALHGGDGDGASMRRRIRDTLEPLADTRGFLVVYPDGYEGNWNDCRGRAPFAAKREGIDDVAFLRALTSRLVRERHVDPSRVFVFGFSNGGYMAYRLALEAPDAFAAVAAVAASLPVEAEMDCRSSGRPVSVMAVNGTADPITLYDGGEVAPRGKPSRGHVRSAPETLEHFARLDGYADPPRQSEVVGADPDLGVKRAEWSRPGAPEVVLFTVKDGGHVIPGPGCEADAYRGACERRFDAVAEAVRFFFEQNRGGSDRSARDHHTRNGA